MVKVLFVCMGNICRSPAAEGIAKKFAEKRGLNGKLEIDSAGTLDYHTDESYPQMIDALRCMPGVGRKSAQRIAFHLLAPRKRCPMPE